jgi:predicted ATPase
MPNTLIGRSEEVLAIDRTLSGLGRGGSAAIEVVGEPGIGKTRLLAELVTRADALGYLVLSGSASELDADLPFWVSLMRSMSTSLPWSRAGSTRSRTTS